MKERCTSLCAVIMAIIGIPPRPVPVTPNRGRRSLPAPRTRAVPLIGPLSFALRSTPVKISAGGCTCVLRTQGTSRSHRLITCHSHKQAITRLALGLLTTRPIAVTRHPASIAQHDCPVKPFRNALRCHGNAGNICHKPRSAIKPVRTTGQLRSRRMSKHWWPLIGRPECTDGRHVALALLNREGGAPRS
jgi:hypothetical protein